MVMSVLATNFAFYRGIGKSYQVHSEPVFYKFKSASTEDISPKDMVRKSSGKDDGDFSHNSLAESTAKRIKRGTKELYIANKTAENNTEVTTKKGKRSVNAAKSSGTNSSGAKSKESFKILSENADGTDASMNRNETWAILAHKKPQKEWISYNPKTMRPPSLDNETGFVKIISWNVNGLRALLKLDANSILQLAQRENFDILCFQETKLQEKDVKAIKQCVDGYENCFWTCSVSKLGYSGTAIVSRIKPLSVTYGLGMEDHDSEGRLVTAEFDSFYLLSAYVPNSGEGLKRLTYRVGEWDPCLSNYIKELEKSKPVILAGDLNCAYEEIDIFDPAGNKRSSGFTIEERQSFGANFLSQGFVDTFRKQHPCAVGYTYWGYRHALRKSNKGWRIDYFLVSESIVDKVHDSYILPDVLGSDHCPIGMVLKI